jgi:hypothetical protein
MSQNENEDTIETSGAFDKVAKLKTTKVRRSNLGEELQEVSLTPVDEIPTEAVTTVQLNHEKTAPTDSLEELPTRNIVSFPSVTELVTYEIKENPIRAKELVRVLGMVTMDWESIGVNGNPINEVPVPPGENPKDFIRSATRVTHISGFRLSTIFGKEVAYISKDSPKWRVTILGEYQVDSPIIQNGSTAEVNVKKFAEERLRAKGYIVGF